MPGPLLVFLGLALGVIGAVSIAYLPLALLFEVVDWWRRRRPNPKDPFEGDLPLVSVVVPGYNEERVIENCAESILASDYPRLELVLVDDGSTDATADIMARIARTHPRTLFIRKTNGGKGSALNVGTRATHGDVVMFVDADGLFGPDTIRETVRAFRDNRIGAVCGDDRPANLDRVQTRLLALISHVGTGLVRRALHMVRCVPVVSGNNGAFRRAVLAEIGRFRTDTLGEDLELTWRVHRAGYRVAFAPRALVYAESPSTVRGLWKQRVRWARGLLQSLRCHRDMVGNPRYGPFGLFMAYNAVAQIAVPLLSLAAAVGGVIALVTGTVQLPVSTAGLLAALGGLGLLSGLLLVTASCALGRSLSDLHHIWTLPLWPLLSLFMSATMLRAVMDEVLGAPAKWNKLDRTGVITVDVPNRIRADEPAEPRPLPSIDAASVVDDDPELVAVRRRPRGLRY